jgi:hypothetical protein
MVAYEFYLNDGCEEPKLIGILHERRKSPLRITAKSIMKWGHLAAGCYVDPNNIHFIRLELRKES